MLETLRAYGADGSPGPGEEDAAAAAAGRVRASGGRARPPRGCRPVPAKWPPPGGWMPRTPPCARCWRWAMDHDAALALRLAVALAPWWVLARAAAGSSTRCCARPPSGPRRAATGGAPRNSGSARQRLTRPIWPGRWAISPRSATPSGTGEPSRVLVDCLDGRSLTLAQAGPDRRGGRRRPPLAGPGPGARLPGRRGGGPGEPQRRRLVRRRPRRRGAAGPAGRAGPGRYPGLDGPGAQLSG